jgi:hypothetical protein
VLSSQHGTHYHPFLDATTGNDIELDPAPEPEDFSAAGNSYLEILLTATSSNGLKTTVSRNILPKTIYVVFDTVPTGLELSIDEEVLTMPYRVLSWEKHNLRVIARNQTDYVFDRWSDGGNQTHTISVPANTSDTPPQYQAFYLEASPSTAVAPAPPAPDKERACACRLPRNATNLKLCIYNCVEVVRSRFSPSG